MLEKPKVSAVITTYKNTDTLTTTINSAIKQTYDDMELVVVDGANSVENQAIVNSFINNKKVKKKIRYIIVEPEAVDYISWHGIQHARNVGCKQAKGEYLAMLDDGGDTWESNKIKKQIELCDEETGLVMCYGRIFSKDSVFVTTPDLDLTYEKLLKSANISATSTFLINKKALIEIGFWNEELRGMHEYDIALRLAKKGYKIKVVPEILMSKVWSTSQVSSYYYIKIAEVMEFWENYSSDALSVLKFKDFVFICVKTVAIFNLMLMGYIFKERIFKIIYPLKNILFWSR